MPITKKQIAGTVYLAFLTALAIYALTQAIHLSLPIPTVIAALTTIAPLLTGIVISTTYLTGPKRYLIQQDELTAKPSKPSPLAILLLLFQAALAGIAFTYTHPASTLDCPLSERWQHLFRAKNDKRIRAIQDAFDCCGFRTVQDMPWPFPSAVDDVKTCSKRFARTQGCLVDWRSSEQRIAGLLVAVDVLALVYLWLVGIERWPQGGWNNWVSGSIPRHPEQRAIEGNENYHDEPVVREGEESTVNQEQPTISLIDNEESMGNEG